MRTLTFVHTMLFALVLLLLIPGVVTAQQTVGNDHVATAGKSPYRAISDAERFSWAIKSTLGAKSLGAKSENGINAALTRSAIGFLGKLASNVIDEFWQDINSRVRKRP